MRANLWAIIPVKPFVLGKSRLAGVLGQRERETLNRKLFDRVLGAAVIALGAERVVAVSADPDAIGHAAERGVHAVRETTQDDLNAALGQACNYAIARDAQAVLVLPSDLPLLAVDDIEALVAALSPAPACVIAPDVSQRATNALIVAPPDPAFFCFGEDSFAAHRRAAETRGAAAVLVRRPALAFDLDTPEDYRIYASLAAAPAAAGAPS